MFANLCQTFSAQAQGQTHFGEQRLLNYSSDGGNCYQSWHCLLDSIDLWCMGLSIGLLGWSKENMPITKFITCPLVIPTRFLPVTDVIMAGKEGFLAPKRCEGRNCSITGGCEQLCTGIPPPTNFETLEVIASPHPGCMTSSWWKMVVKQSPWEHRCFIPKCPCADLICKNM